MRCNVAGAVGQPSLGPTLTGREKEEMRTRAATLKVWAVLLAVMATAIMVALAIGTQPAKAAFPGSNGAIAFVNADVQVYRMSSDGFGQTKLSDSAGNSFEPNWSADGKKIVFVNSELGNADISWMNSDGSGEITLTDDPGNIDTSPTFFPNYHKIAFTRNILSNQDIFVMRVNDAGTITDEPTRLTTSPRDDFNPTVSPDGKRIAFVSNRGAGSDYDIYVMRANAPESATNKPVKLTKSAANDLSPEWSPDGKRIAFVSTRSGNSEIYVMKPVPESMTNIPRNRTRNPAEDTQPAFSPDGTKIAFVSNRTGVSLDIFKMKANAPASSTNRPVNLTNRAGNQDSPSWQPDL